MKCIELLITLHIPFKATNSGTRKEDGKGGKGGQEGGREGGRRKEGEEEIEKRRRERRKGGRMGKEGASSLNRSFALHFHPRAVAYWGIRNYKIQWL